MRESPGAERQKAISAATLTIGIPFGMGLLFRLLIEPRIFLDDIVQSIVNLWVITGMVVLLGSAIGSFAHWWFFHSSIKGDRMAIAIALLFDVSMIGWMIVAMFLS